jgi:tripartite-type tricarboxylate transporter receptor subunit TctC
MNGRICLLVWVAAGVTGSLPARADAVADFYKNHPIELLIGATTGNDFDMRGRMLARYMGQHIPGHPNIIVRNMPGGGGIVAMNHMATRAVRDGTTLHMMFPNMGPLQVTGEPGIAFDLRQFYFIGNTTDSQNVMSAWHLSGVKTIEDAKQKELVLGATPGNTGIYYARALNQMIGTKFKVISGYPGGNEINLAMERGEIDGRASITYASWKSTKPQWLADGLVVHLVQVGHKRHPELPQIPLMHELATNTEDRQVLEFLSASVSIARAVVTTPGVPAERITALRRAFDATIASPELLAEAAKQNMDISPLTGEEAQAISDAIVNAPPKVIERAKAIMNN